MRRSRARLSAAAHRDLLEIAEHVAGQSGEERAAALVRAIGRAMALHARRPAVGRARPELGSLVRSFLFKSWRVYYVPEEQGIGILRILHTRRDLRSAWADDHQKDE